jgi:hypothetical protein
MMDDVYLPRKEKESLCFLILGLKKQQQDYTIAGWEVCYSYGNEITRKSVYWSSIERCCLTSLIRELLWCLIHKTSIVTYRKIDLPALRTRLLVNNISMFGFRELQYICIQEFLQNYFFVPGGIQHLSIESLAEVMKIKNTNAISAEILHEIFTKTQPLLPIELI